MIVLIGVGSIAAVFLIWYVVVARRRANVRFSKFVEASENCSRILETKFVPAVKAAEEAMLLLADAWQYAAIRWAQDLIDEQQDSLNVPTT